MNAFELQRRHTMTSFEMLHWPHTCARTMQRWELCLSTRMKLPEATQRGSERQGGSWLADVDVAVQVTVDARTVQLWALVENARTRQIRYLWLIALASDLLTSTVSLRSVTIQSPSHCGSCHKDRLRYPRNLARSSCVRAYCAQLSRHQPTSASMAVRIAKRLCR